MINTENLLILTFIQKNVSANEQPFVEKYDIGGTNFWPIEHFDMVHNHFTNILLHRLIICTRNIIPPTRITVRPRE